MKTKPRPMMTAHTPEEVAAFTRLAFRASAVRTAARLMQAVGIAAIIFGLFVMAIEYSRSRGTCAVPAIETAP